MPPFLAQAAEAAFLGQNSIAHIQVATPCRELVRGLVRRGIRPRRLYRASGFDFAELGAVLRSLKSRGHVADDRVDTALEALVRDVPGYRYSRDDQHVLRHCLAFLAFANSNYEFVDVVHFLISSFARFRQRIRFDAQRLVIRLKCTTHASGNSA
jgi:hypothetical protein